MHEHDMPAGEHPANDHERTDADVRAIIKTGVALLALVMATGAGLRWCYLSIARHDPIAEEPVTGDPHERLPPGPRLQTMAARDMAAFRREEDAKLASFGWVDQSHRFARVPITTAIEHVAKQGLPKWPAKSEVKP
ncbi:MAG TPA: hypothetical protein VHZ24_04425 [Pirellulales bacterium]|nr:hypothetical protein [Pirellulales bacterium]